MDSNTNASKAAGFQNRRFLVRIPFR